MLATLAGVVGAALLALLDQGLRRPARFDVPPTAMASPDAL